MWPRNFGTTLRASGASVFPSRQKNVGPKCPVLYVAKKLKPDNYTFTSCEKWPHTPHQSKICTIFFSNDSSIFCVVRRRKKGKGKKKILFAYVQNVLVISTLFWAIAAPHEIWDFWSTRAIDSIYLAIIKQIQRAKNQIQSRYYFSFIWCHTEM